MSKLLTYLLAAGLFVEMANSAEPDFKERQARIADAIEKIPVSRGRWFLYSLDPHDASRILGIQLKDSSTVFHGFPVLGKVEIIPDQEKADLMAALAQGVRENDGREGGCFDPRHGVRIICDSTTNDFVICFKCIQVEAFGFPISSHFLITSSPEPAYDKLLKKYQLKKAE